MGALCYLCRDLPSAIVKGGDNYVSDGVIQDVQRFRTVGALRYLCRGLPSATVNGGDNYVSDGVIQDAKRFRTVGALCYLCRNQPSVIFNGGDNSIIQHNIYAVSWPLMTVQWGGRQPNRVLMAAFL